MSSTDQLWENVKSFLKSLPITSTSNKKNVQQLNIFLRTVKVYQNGSDIYLLVPNMIVKTQLEREYFYNLIVTAFNECAHEQCNVVIELNKNFSAAKLSKTQVVNNQPRYSPNNNSHVNQQAVGNSYNDTYPQNNSYYSQNNRGYQNTTASEVNNVGIGNSSNFYQNQTLYNKNPQIDFNYNAGVNVSNNVSPQVNHVRDTPVIDTFSLVPSEVPIGNAPVMQFAGDRPNNEEPQPYYNSSEHSDGQADQYDNNSSHSSSEDQKFIGSYRTLNDDEIKSNRFYKLHSIDPAKRFDNFVEGPTNQKLCDSGKLIAKTPGNSDRNPFFVYGESGLGKTHILFAIGNAILKERPNLRVMYVNMSTWVTDFHMALDAYYMTKEKSVKLLTQFKTLYRNLDVLLIDDMQEIVKRETTTKIISNELIDLMNDVNLKRCQLIFASNIHPQVMVNVDGRLRNRFQSGVCIKVEPPDYDTRRRIVELKAREMNLSLDKSSIDFIAYKMQTNVRTLEGHIKTVGAFCINIQGTITVDIVKEALHDVLAGKEKLLTVDNIKKTVADYYKITVKEIDSSARPASIAHPRMMAMYLARELTNKSFPSLGKEFGGKDHSTVMNAKNRIEKLIKTNPQFREDYENLKLQLV